MTRHERERRNKDRRRDRQQLVHAAGCVLRECASKWYLDDYIRLDPECALTPGTRIPRSLRRVFGFRVQPAQPRATPPP